MQGNLRPTPEVSYPSRFFSLFFPAAPKSCTLVTMSQVKIPISGYPLAVSHGWAMLKNLGYARCCFERADQPLLPAGRESVGPRITCKTVSDDTWKRKKKKKKKKRIIFSHDDCMCVCASLWQVILTEKKNMERNYVNLGSTWWSVGITAQNDAQSGHNVHTPYFVSILLM